MMEGNTALKLDGDYRSGISVEPSDDEGVLARITRNSNDLFDDRVATDDSPSPLFHQPRDKRISLVGNEKPGRITGPDGKAFEGSISPYSYSKKGGAAEATKDGFWDRWKDYKKLLHEKYPFVKGKQLHRLAALPYHYVMKSVMGNIANYFNNNNDIASALVSGIADTMRLNHETQYKTIPFDVFPRIVTMTVFANGATDIERMYTLEKNGYEMPIQFQLLRGGLPSTDEIIEAAEFTDKEGISLFNKCEKRADKTIDKTFISRGIDKYTRGDYSNYFVDEPERLERWIMKDESWAIYQYGERDLTEETNLNTSLPGQFAGRIKIYKEPGKESGFWYRLGNLMGDKTPSSNKMFWYWQSGDWIYDFTDILFGPAEASFRKLGFPKAALRNLMDQEYKVVANVRRKIFSPKGYNFTYQLPGKDRTHVSEAERNAVDIGYN